MQNPAEEVTESNRIACLSAMLLSYSAFGRCRCFAAENIFLFKKALEGSVLVLYYSLLSNSFLGKRIGGKNEEDAQTLHLLRNLK